MVKKSKGSHKVNRKGSRKVSRKVQNKGSRKVGSFRMNTGMRETPHIKALRRSGSVAHKVDLNLSNLPDDIVYTISKSLTPRDRSRLASTSKSTRSIRRSIHEAPMTQLEFNDNNDMKQYLKYLRYLLAENIPISKSTINIKISVNSAPEIEKWLNEAVKLLSLTDFNKITINIDELMVDKKYINSFEYDKFKNIHIRTIYMVDIDTTDNRIFLRSFDGMKIDRVIYSNDYLDYQDNQICQYLCKVETVKMIHSQRLPLSRMNFSYFGDKDSKTRNISIINYNQDTLRYFSGMNCVQVSNPNGQRCNVADLNDVNYLLLTSKHEFVISDSFNINHLITCVFNKGYIDKYPLLEFYTIKDIRNVIKNIHLPTYKNEAEYKVVEFFSDKGVNVIEESNPCFNPVYDIFERFK